MSFEQARAITYAATGRHDPCGMCDGGGPWPEPWAVVDDIKGDGHWDNEFHVLDEGGEGHHLATFQYRPHAELFAWARNVMPAMLDALEAAEALPSKAQKFRAGEISAQDLARAELVVVDALGRVRDLLGDDDMENDDGSR